MERRTFEIKNSSGSKAKITIEAPTITGAEQNLVILDKACRPIAVLELQPGFDRTELAAPKQDSPK